MNLLRERRPTEYEFDPNISKAIRTGDYRNDSAETDRIFNSRRDGLIGIVSQTETDISESIEDSLFKNFNASNPEDSMREVLSYARHNSPEAEVSLVKVYRDESGELLATYGSYGRQHIYLQTGKEIKPLSESDQEKVETIRLNAGDRIVVRSVDAVGINDDDNLSENEMNEAMAISKPKKAAKAFSDKAGSAVVLDVLSTDGGVGWLTSRFNKDRTEESDGEQDDDRRRGLGRLALVGGGAAGLAAYIGSKRAERRDRKHDRMVDREIIQEREEPVLNDQTVVHESRDRDIPFVEPHTSSSSVRISREEDYETRRRGNGRKALMIGALLVGTYVTMRFGLDLGDDAPHWLSGRPDTGMDINPWGPGDLDDGNRQGWDFNPTNENLAWNDDPVNANFRDTGGLDVLPPFIDGDWLSMNEGLDVDWPNSDSSDSGVGVEPSTDVDGDRDIDDPKATGNTPDVDLDAPEVTPPEVEPVEPPAPAPPAWAPDTFTIESGHGLIQEIHELGHEVAGYENFTASDSTQIYEAARERFGDNLLNLPDHAGNDLYRVGDDLRISAPGQAQWANQALEQFIFEEMEKLAKAKN